MDVVRRDDDRRVLESHDFGSLVRDYRRRLEVDRLRASEARCSDRLDLYGGLFTDLMFPTFVSMYERRHEQRLKRLLARKPG